MMISLVREPLIAVKGRKLLCHAGAFLTAATLGILITMWLDRTPPVDLIAASITPNPAEANGDIDVNYTVKELYPCQGQSHRIIVDSAGGVHEYQDVLTIVGAPERPIDRNRILHIHRTLKLPKGIHSGSASYRPSIVWRCNPIQKYLWPLTVEYAFPLEVK